LDVRRAPRVVGVVADIAATHVVELAAALVFGVAADALIADTGANGAHAGTAADVIKKVPGLTPSAAEAPAL
jgi:hypothetical protein